MLRYVTRAEEIKKAIAGGSKKLVSADGCDCLMELAAPQDESLTIVTRAVNKKGEGKEEGDEGEKLRKGIESNLLLRLLSRSEGVLF